MFYSVSIVCLIVFSWDGLYEHYEAAALVAFYVAYIATMAHNDRLMAAMQRNVYVTLHCMSRDSSWRDTRDVFGCFSRITCAD